MESGSESITQIKPLEEKKTKAIVKVEVKEECKIRTDLFDDNQYVALRVVCTKKILDKEGIKTLFSWYGVSEDSIRLSKNRNNEASVLFSSSEVCEKACREKNDAFVGGSKEQ